MNKKAWLGLLVILGVARVQTPQAQTDAGPRPRPEAVVVQTWMDRLQVAAPKMAGGSPSRKGNVVLAEPAPSVLPATTGMSSSTYNQLAMQQLVTDWRESKKEADFEKIAEQVHMVATENGIMSKVTVETSRGTNALVRYQTVDERKRGEAPWTCASPTKATEEMPLGCYYIWSIRNGRETSSTYSKYRIAAPEEKITLLEK